ncbi:MAG: hypothetical protein KJ000_15520, partial [Pirellulaceae bacterium]|nr:hypothetical protein [Pirellulaceae bacterium]
LLPVPVGSIAWEKRDADGLLLGGAQFTITPDPTSGLGILTILDNGPGDADPALGQILVLNAVPGTYTVTETVAPLGYAIDTDPTRVVVVTLDDLNVVIGVQGFNDPAGTGQSDFHNSLLPIPVGSIAWEKRDADGLLLGGAQFTITPDPLGGGGILTILDNGPGDADPALGQILVLNALPGTYTVTETVAPLGYAIDTDPTRVVVVTLDDLNVVIGVPGFNDPGDFHNSKRVVIVIGEDKNPHTPQGVTVLDPVTGEVLWQFFPYGPTFQGGVRVAVGDLTGDGVVEIVTAPGWGIVAEVHVYTLDGVLLTSFLPYGPNFDDGVQVAIADVDGDGLNDIITVPSWGPAEVKVFRNVLVGGVPTFDAANPYRDFLAFPASFIGGAVVAAADMGSTPLPSGPFDNTQQDQQAELVVGSNAGTKTTVKVFDVSGLIAPTPNAVPAAAASFTPFSTGSVTFKGGVSLDVARINADPIPDIVVGAGVNGNSRVDVWAWSNTTSATLSSLSANGIGFTAFTGATRRAPVRVAALDTNGDDIADAIYAVQGPGGTTGQIRAFNITNVSPLEVSAFTTVPGSFPQPYFIAASEPMPAVVSGFGAGFRSASALTFSEPAFSAPESSVPAFSASFDFGSTKSPVEPGYQSVAHRTKYSVQTGFGWLSGSIKALDRRTGSALDRDANLTSNGIFAVDVPNGSYAVTVRLGDLGRTVRDEMAVFLQGVQVDRVTTAARSVESRTYQLAVTDGQLTLNLRDFGGRDKSVSITGLVVTAVAPDTNRPTVTIGLAAGQTAPATGAPLLLDVVFSEPVSGFSAADVQWTWTGAGSLTSTVSGGGAVYQIAVSGMESSGTLQAEIGADAAFDLSDNPNHAAMSAAIDYRYEKRFDFGSTKSPVEPGYQSVAHRTKYSVQTGFGWLSGSIKALDRRTGSALDRDANLTSNGIFAVDVPDGSYAVTVRLGDLGRTVRDEMAVYLQGVQVDLVTTAARSVESRTYEVAITNGQLMLQLKDLGGRDKSVSIAGLTIVDIVDTGFVPSVIPAGEGEADGSLDEFQFVAPVSGPAAPLLALPPLSVLRDNPQSDLDYDTVWPQATGIAPDLDPVKPARSPFDLGDDLLGLDAMLADIALDVARGWSLSA